MTCSYTQRLPLSRCFQARRRLARPPPPGALVASSQRRRVSQTPSPFSLPLSRQTRRNLPGFPRMPPPNRYPRPNSAASRRNLGRFPRNYRSLAEHAPLLRFEALRPPLLLLPLLPLLLPAVAGRNLRRRPCLRNLWTLPFRPSAVVVLVVEGLLVVVVAAVALPERGSC